MFFWIGIPLLIIGFVISSKKTMVIGVFLIVLDFILLGALTASTVAGLHAGLYMGGYY